MNNQILEKIISNELEYNSYIELTHKEEFNCINIKIGKQSKQIIKVSISIGTYDKIYLNKAEYILEKDNIYPLIKEYILNIKEKDKLINKITVLYLKNTLSEEEYQNIINLLKPSTRIRNKKYCNIIGSD